MYLVYAHTIFFNPLGGGAYIRGGGGHLFFQPHGSPCASVIDILCLCPNFTTENAILLFNFAKIAAKIGHYYGEYGLSTSKHIHFGVILLGT